MKKKTYSTIGVLLLVDKLDLGGGARRIKVYCDYLDRLKFHPVVVIRSSLIARNVDSVIGASTPRLCSDDPEAILNFARIHQVQALYCWYDGQYHEDLYHLLSAAKKQGIAIIANNVFSYVDSRMDALCDVIVFQTKFMRYKFEQHLHSEILFSLKRHTVLPNPVHSEYFEQFRISAKQREESRSKLGFLATDIVFGRFGRNDIVKWGDVLTLSMLAVVSQPTMKFLIVGMPRSRRWLFYFLSFLDPKISNTIVILPPTGVDKELFELMQCTDAVVHSVKIGEGCSNAINECMYWGKPVITNPTPHCDNGQVEQVRHQKSGVIARGVQEWKSAMFKLAHDNALREKLGKFAASQVKTTIDAPLVIQEFEQILSQVVEKSRKSTPITLTSQAYDAFVFHYRSDPRLSASVLPKTVLGKIADGMIRGFSYLEFKFFNG